jgi:hypothetical protein
MKLQKGCFSFQYCNLINQHQPIFYKHLLLGTDNLRLGRYFNFKQCLSYICMYRMQVLPPSKYHISHKFSQQYIYHIFGHAAQSPFFFTEICVFHKLLFFVHKIFMFYTKDALKFTSPALQPKGLDIWYWEQNPGFHSPLPAPLLQPTGVKLSVPTSMGAWVLEVQGFSWGRIYIFMI